MILGLAGALNASAPAATPAMATCDPALAALFTPPRPVAGRYAVCVTPESIERVIAAGGAQYGAIEALGPLDAFGAAGPYDRSLVARLYGGTRAKVAHGWAELDGRLVSTTLISPYPDTSLTHLLPGTLEIRWTSGAAGSDTALLAR